MALRLQMNAISWTLMRVSQKSQLYEFNECQRFAKQILLQLNGRSFVPLLPVHSTTHVFSMVPFHNILSPVLLQELARSWLKEDQPSFDLQGVVAGDTEIVAKIYCKSPGVLAGVPFVNAVLKEVDCSPNWFFMEGEHLDPSTVGGPVEVAYVGGKGQNVLLAERVILNVLARCSGVATKSRRVKRKLSQLGWEGYLAGSRKTTPGFRMVEKYGLLVGGVATHRHDLSNMVMLKG